jgi:hypothetical protein
MKYTMPALMHGIIESKSNYTPTNYAKCLSL